MKKPIFILAIVSLGVLQVTVADFVRIFNVKPDLLLMGACLGSLYFELPWAIASAVLAGVLKDSVSLSQFGTNTLLFALWSFLVFRLAKKVSIDSDPRCAALVFLISMAHNTTTGLLFVYSGNPVPLGIFLRTVSVGSIYTALVVPLFSRLIRK
jgi:rod shape-determining protein MreD